MIQKILIFSFVLFMIQCNDNMQLESPSTNNQPIRDLIDNNETNSTSNTYRQPSTAPRKNTIERKYDFLSEMKEFRLITSILMQWDIPNSRRLPSLLLVKREVFLLHLLLCHYKPKSVHTEPEHRSSRELCPHSRCSYPSLLRHQSYILIGSLRLSLLLVLLIVHCRYWLLLLP